MLGNIPASVVAMLANDINIYNFAPGVISDMGQAISPVQKKK